MASGRWVGELMGDGSVVSIKIIFSYRLKKSINLKNLKL